MASSFHRAQSASGSFWTHPSVVAFAENCDPVESMISHASAVALDAMQAGWSGPPYDPFQLAHHLGIRVVPSENVSDARILPGAEGRLQIEFNPNRPKSRIRYSIAHDLAHTLFQDCSEVVRHRLARNEQTGDDWQLEMLCNIGAAEFLMPVGGFPELRAEWSSIDRLLDLRAQFEVSMEALLLRVIRLTDRPCAMFAASRKESGSGPGSYQIDYSVCSRSWEVKLASGTPLPRTKCLPECTAIGFTSSGDEHWPHPAGLVQVECVGIAPFPSKTYPRVVGMLHPLKVQEPKDAGVTFVRGDATETRGQGQRILAHVVNDKAALWGSGFGFAVRKKWPQVQAAFKDWAAMNPNLFRLGSVFMSPATADVTAFQMICQHGYGPSAKPRVRYSALKSCLEQLAQHAVKEGASVHMPRIGSGQAGGSWGLIGQLIDEVLCARGVRVTVYDLPGQASGLQTRQEGLFDALR